MKSKTLFLSLLLLGTTLFTSSISYSQSVQKITAKYQEINDNGQLLFVDGESKKHVFDEVDYEVEIDLYDDINLGKKFNISWKEEEVEAYDEEGEVTGKNITYRTIMTVSPAK